MFRKIATGLLAVAATGAVALSMPAAASATTADGYSWGPVYAKHHLAKAQGWIGVEWDEHQTSNTVHLRGRLYDLDQRTYGQGGKCAHVRFQAAGFDHEWDAVHARKFCGYPGSKKFRFDVDDVAAVRVKVCQIHPHQQWVSKCGHWEYLYAAESE
ncbi:hypothetical protein AB0K05_13435 [Nonomuraea sp. NPDC049486]|uniref:hypothetical protein n=1 Tax=Nonomuraea sp. NPDC049486 TaxID=3155773 RepID=UPI00342DB9C2